MVMHASCCEECTAARSLAAFWKRQYEGMVKEHANEVRKKRVARAILTERCTC